MAQNPEFPGIECMEIDDFTREMLGLEAPSGSMDANHWQHGVGYCGDTLKNGDKFESNKDPGNAVYHDARLYSTGIEVTPSDSYRGDVTPSDSFGVGGLPSFDLDDLQCLLMNVEDTTHHADASHRNTVENLEVDMEAKELVDELYRPDSKLSTHQTNHSDAQQVQPQSQESDDCDEPLSVKADRVTEIGKMAGYIKTVIERRSSSRPEDTSSKLKVHEVILVILLNALFGDKSKDLRRILAFCDEDGREVSGESEHFKTLDTETMGALWMMIKGNRMPSYDTFARAMRVRREKSAKANESSYFDYLETGLRSKKRVYRFGPRAMADKDRIKQTLKAFADQQQAFGSGNY